MSDLSGFIAVRPRQGYLHHVIQDRPDERAKMTLGRRLMFGGPGLCGFRARSGWFIVGSPEKPTPLSEIQPHGRRCEACAERAGWRW